MAIRASRLSNCTRREAINLGVKETTIRKVLVDNPRRFLAFVPKS